jgi:hypothetical protein
MSVIKMMKVGRPKLAADRKKISWSLSIDQQLLVLIKQKAKHGKAAAWANAKLWEAVNK